MSNEFICYNLLIKIKNNLFYFDFIFVFNSELIKQKSEFRTNELKYFESTKKMIQFEKEAENAFIKRLSTNGIRLLKTNKNAYNNGSEGSEIFYFQVKVSKNLIAYFLVKSLIEKNIFVYITLKRNMRNMCAAIENNLVDQFTLISKSHPPIDGQIKFVCDDKIIVEIKKPHIDLAMLLLPSVRFEIVFKQNSIPIEMQFRAVESMQEKGLFSKLINNSEYDKVLPHEESFETTKTTITTYVKI